jgi:hypothetical protein
VAPSSFPPPPGKEAGKHGRFYKARCVRGGEVEVRGEIDDACSNGVGQDVDACRSGDELPVGAPLKSDAEIRPHVSQAGQQCRHPMFLPVSLKLGLPGDSGISADLSKKSNITRRLRACRGGARGRGSGPFLGGGDGRGVVSAGVTEVPWSPGGDARAACGHAVRKRA